MLLRSVSCYERTAEYGTSDMYVQAKKSNSPRRATIVRTADHARRNVRLGILKGLHECIPYGKWCLLCLTTPATSRLCHRTTIQRHQCVRRWCTKMSTQQPAIPNTATPGFMERRGSCCSLTSHRKFHAASVFEQDRKRSCRPSQPVR
jgi:hypothetical protein